MPNGKVAQPVNVQKPAVQKAVASNYGELKILSAGLAFGIVGAIGMIVLTIAGIFGQFNVLTSLLVNAYGFLGYSVGWLGVLLGAIYGFSDLFVFGILVAWFYNMFTN